MKYTIERTDGEEEIIIRCKERTPEIDRIIAIASGNDKRILGSADNGQVMLDRNEILYIESVDGKTFAYTERQAVRLPYTLTVLGEMLREINFFRCSKSMIININCIKELKSLASNRIDATMYNGEHIIISRTYASALRKILKGDNDYE